MITAEGLAIVVVLCATLTVLSYKFNLLTISGALASFAVGMIIGTLGGIGWLVTLIVFTFMGFGVTKFRFRLKEVKGLQEGKKGERTYRNVLANGLVPVLVAVVSFAIGAQDTVLAAVGYISAVAVAASDTTASELGVLYPNAYLITTGERVPPGTDGGVSFMGTVACIVAAAVATFVGWAAIRLELFNPLMLIPIVMGVTGCMLDSVIGATLERRGKVTKLGNNILSMAIGALLGCIIYLLV
jgi:uncharacterized protein (TIGR00297 family)